MKYAHGQIIHFALRAMYQHAEVVSGAYKFRQTQRGVNPEDVEKYRKMGLLIEPSEDGSRMGMTPRWRNITDEEKLQDSLATMRRHIEFVSECIERLGGE